MKIEMVRYLLDEIEAEKSRMQRFQDEKRRARKEADKTGKYVWECEIWNEPFPNKTRIVENCKLVRRLLSEISKEAQRG